MAADTGRWWWVGALASAVGGWDRGGESWDQGLRGVQVQGPDNWFLG